MEYYKDLLLFATGVLYRVRLAKDVLFLKMSNLVFFFCSGSRIVENMLKFHIIENEIVLNICILILNYITLNTINYPNLLVNFIAIYIFFGPEVFEPASVQDFIALYNLCRNNVIRVKTQIRPDDFFAGRIHP